MDLKVEDILNCTNGKLVIGDKNKICKNYSRDTRTIQKGDTFVAIKGDSFDGNLFWEEKKNIQNKINVSSRWKIQSKP